MNRAPDNEPAVDFAAESIEELYEMAPCGYLTTAIDGRIVKVNRTLTEWLGYEAGELTSGKRFVDVLTVGGRIFYETHFNLLLRMQDSVNEIALDLVCKDGRVFPTLLNARQKRNEAGEPVLNRFTIFNATERRMYERDLLAARDLLQTTLFSIGDGVIATDAEGRITFMNPMAERLSGWTEDSAKGKQIEEVLLLVKEGTSERIENPITHALRTSSAVGLENHTELISTEGTRFTVDDSASPIRDANGTTIGGVLVFRDVTERRRTEKELEDTYRELEAKASELRRSNEDLSQFAYVASHDLRSPLNTVVQFAQLLERKYGEQLGDGKGLLEHVIGGAKRMASLIEDLLVYARVSSDASLSPADVDVNEQVKVAVENLKASIDKTGAVITLDPLPSVRVDRTSLVQIFQNLIGNAIHYRSSLPPRIHIAAEEKHEHWLFSCTDNGIGIAQEHQTQIFEPFKRLHGTDLPGSGIGLAVCRKIVERYNGRIWVQSELQQGSTFFFTLPKAALGP